MFRFNPKNIMRFENPILQLTFVLVFFLFFIFPAILGLWKVFEKAGQKGWKCIIPVYNNMIGAEIAGKPKWWGLICYIPFFGFFFGIWLLKLISKNFGKDSTFTLGLVVLPFIFFPILGFGGAQYVKPIKQSV